MKSALLCLALLTSIATAADTTPESFIGKKMPAFSMTELGGKKLTNKSVKGKVVIMDFWATWCTVCHRVSPLMQDLHAKYSDKGLLVVGADSQERHGGTAALYKKRGHYTYAFTENNDKLADSLGITGLPMVIVIDRKGIVHSVRGGFTANMGKDMDAEIAKLLAEKA